VCAGLARGDLLEERIAMPPREYKRLRRKFPGDPVLGSVALITTPASRGARRH
jgi:hypothetical protein